MFITQGSKYVVSIRIYLRIGEALVRLTSSLRNGGGDKGSLRELRKKGGWRPEGGGGKEPGMGAVEMEKRSGRKSWSQCK